MKILIELEGLGESLVNEIIKQGMFAIKHPDPAESHVFAWSANSYEQLECVVAKFIYQNAESIIAKIKS